MIHSKRLQSDVIQDESFEFIHGVLQFEFMEIEFKYEVFVDDIEFEDCENCELNCIRTSLKSKSSQQS